MCLQVFGYFIMDRRNGGKTTTTTLLVLTVVSKTTTSHLTPLMWKKEWETLTICSMSLWLAYGWCNVCLALSHHIADVVFRFYGG